MLGRHHGSSGDGSTKHKEAEPEVHLCGCQPWGVHGPTLLSGAVVMECSVCSGPYMGCGLEDTWQPRQRTQAGAFQKVFLSLHR